MKQRIVGRVATRLLFAALLVAGVAVAPHSGSAGDSGWSAVAEVDLGEDTGQNLGSILEVRASDGSAVLGAGFLGVYNTEARSDRNALHVFVRSPRGDETPFRPEPIARPGPDAGVYLHDRGGRLLARSRGGNDRSLHAWSEADGAWRVETDARPLEITVVGRVLDFDARGIRHDGRLVLELAEGEGRLGEPYYAGGRLFYRRHDRDGTPWTNELRAVRWRPGDETTLTSRDGDALPLTTPREFIYAWGQLDDETLVVSNLGGVRVFDGRRWRTLRAPVPGVSYQVYSALNFRDLLLLGHYPTGELLAYDGAELRRMAGWPPVMPGVSRNAREAQTLTIYGGEVYCGVWPWGEVWKLDPDRNAWRFQGRLFSHPAPTAATTHPYETETTRLDPVLNRWGQRVTSMVPLGDALYLSTSAKSSAPWSPRFDFMSREQAAEYGRVYRFKKPGALAAPIEWRPGRTVLEVRVEDGRVEALQDGRSLGSAPCDAAAMDPARGPFRIAWGDGIYGRFRGRFLARRSTGTTPPGRPFLGTYLHLLHCVDLGAPLDVRRRQLDATLDRLRASGLRVAFPYANTTSGRTVYHSTVVPEAVTADWDPLDQFVRGARERGIEVWPVICVTECGADRPVGILEKHPEWATRDPDGRPIGFFSPGSPGARAHLVSLLSEVVTRFRPEGILLDYLRYNNRPGQLDAASLARFEDRFGPGAATSAPGELQRFREEQLTVLARQISFALRPLRPGLRIGLYTWGPHVITGHLVAQDWKTWLERGYIDHLNASGYYYPEQNGPGYRRLFVERMRRAERIAHEAAPEVTVSTAIGFKTSHGEIRSADQAIDLLRATREAGLDGVGIYRWTSLLPFLDELEARDAWSLLK